MLTISGGSVIGALIVSGILLGTLFLWIHRINL